MLRTSTVRPTDDAQCENNATLFLRLSFLLKFKLVIRPNFHIKPDFYELNLPWFTAHLVQTKFEKYFFGITKIKKSCFWNKEAWDSNPNLDLSRYPNHSPDAYLIPNLSHNPNLLSDLSFDLISLIYFSTNQENFKIIDDVTLFSLPMNFKKFVWPTKK